MWLKVWIVKENIKITQAGSEVGKFAVLCAGTGTLVIGSRKERVPGTSVILSCCYSLFMSVLQLQLDLSLTVRGNHPSVCSIFAIISLLIAVFLVGGEKKSVKFPSFEIRFDDVEKFLKGRNIFSRAIVKLQYFCFQSHQITGQTGIIHEGIYFFSGRSSHLDLILIRNTVIQEIDRNEL